MKTKRHKVVNNAKEGVQIDSRAVGADNDGGKQKASALPKQSETCETEIEQPADVQKSAEQTAAPKLSVEHFKLSPDLFAKVNNLIEADELEEQERVVYANSIESRVGYDSLIRLLGEYFGRQIAYFRSVEGGALSLEEAREAAYSRNYNEELAVILLNELLSAPSDSINFEQLWLLHQQSAPMAENLWELIKRQAQHEFESGHRAGAVFEPADYMTDAWNRASYLGLRESLCKEWQPKGGIELTMIDAIAQAWLQLQFWTKESVLRSRTKSREVDYKLQNQKKTDNERNKNRPPNELWDIPLVSEQSAVEHAAQMADRWQRMYFRAIRSLRDWRRYTQQVTINNPNQVNIATDGGQQINVSGSMEEKDSKKKE
jgi:hypothetical protein